MKTVRLGIFGCGNVGQGVIRHLKMSDSYYEQKYGLKFEIVKILVKDINRDRGVDKSLLTTNWKEIAEDPSIDLFVELIGGTTTAAEIAHHIIKSGKPLITANKALLAEQPALWEESAKQNIPLYYEASVAGGIPIVKILRECLLANRILGIYGIINGTCNYILSQMSDKNLPFVEALQQAKDLGYAETDDRLDVDGIDAAHKACILAKLAFGVTPHFSQVFVEGIRHIDILDFQFAKELGYSLKHLGIIKSHDNAIELRIHPTLVPQHNLLSSVHQSYNAVFVEGDIVGKTCFYGRGAGPDATASAVIHDLIEAGLAFDKKRTFSPFVHRDEKQFKLLPREEMKMSYYLRFTHSSIDPEKIKAKLKEDGIEIEQELLTSNKKSSSLVLITSPVIEKQMIKVITSFEKRPQLIRMENNL